MAVEVLDYQGFSKLGCEGDPDQATALHLERMQSLVSLLAQQEDCNDPSLLHFQKLTALLGRSGHARFRRAPPAAPVSWNGSSCASPQGQHVFAIRDKARSSAALHDAAAQTKQPNSSCTQFKLDDNTDASADNLHDFQSLPNRKDGKGYGCACSVSMNDDPSSRSCANTPEIHQSLSPCKGGNGDRCARAHPLPRSLHVSGHARCRDSTAQKVCHQDSHAAYETTACQLQHPPRSCAEPDQASFVPSKTNSSFLSSVSMDGGGATVSNGKPVISSGRPPLPPKKRKFPEKIEEWATTKCHNSENCHCAKRRKSTLRRVLRVSTIGLNNTGIPEDGYSWCRYGQKLSKDSSQPRVYYKCGSVRGCPARKHVERASDDRNTLIVTYGRGHLHPQIHKVVSETGGCKGVDLQFSADNIRLACA